MLPFGVFLTIFGAMVLYDTFRVRPGDETRPGWRRTTGRVVRAYWEPGAFIAGPAPNIPMTFWVEYEFEVGGKVHRDRHAARESYVVRVKGFTRRLRSLREGEEIPVWYANDGGIRSTVMPDAVAGTILPRHIGWWALVLGLGLLGTRLAMH